MDLGRLALLVDWYTWSAFWALFLLLAWFGDHLGSLASTPRSSAEKIYAGVDAVLRKYGKHTVFLGLKRSAWAARLLAARLVQ